MAELLDEAPWQPWELEQPPKRWGRSAATKALKWASIAGLLALGGLWSRVTPFEVVARFIVGAGAILVMAHAVLARRYALAAVSAALAVLYNPLTPLFYFAGGDFQRAVLVASATPFLASLIWRDMRKHRHV
jgi:hypothetical protein